MEGFTLQEGIEISVIRSSRHTVAIQVKRDGQIIVRAPRQMSRSKILAIVKEKEGWILSHLKEIKDRQEREPIEGLSDEEIQSLYKKAREVLPKKTGYYAKKMGVDYGRITIRMQKTRWGSCSSKGNLNFNCLLVLAPEEVQDYVVVHELCHRKQMNHSDLFWEEVEKVLPDFRKQKRWLKENGNYLMQKGFKDIKEGR